MNRISKRVNIVTCLGLALLIILPLGRAEGASGNESKLRKLALKKFTTLSEAEEKLLREVITGELIDYCGKSVHKDPAHANQWDKEKREIRAKLVAWLCTDEEASAMVTHKGLRIKGARIEGELDLEFGVILFPLCFEKCAFMRKINLRYAEIRYLELSGTHTNYIDGGGLKVKDSLYFMDGFRANGFVRLYGATIGKWLMWRDASSTLLDLQSASIGTLYDDPTSWQPKQYKLHGFVYKAIDEEAEELFEKKRDVGKYSVKKRIKWLNGQLNFSSQPYEQLAEVFRKSGKVEDAKEILIAKNRNLRKHNTLTWSKKYWYYVLGPMIGYGYRPLNALWILGTFIALGIILFGIGYQKGLITPQRGSAYIQRHTGIVIPFDNGRQLSDIYPKFNFLMYSFDAFVPLIDLHQAKYWLPNANRGPELLNISGFGLHTGGLLRLYLWVHIIMGWLLTTLLIVGLSGLIH